MFVCPNCKEKLKLVKANIFKCINKSCHLPKKEFPIINEIPNQTYRPRPWDKSNNPMKAVKEFLKQNKNFKINKKLNHNHLIASAPNGYIYRLK